MATTNNNFWNRVKHRSDNIKYTGFNYRDGQVLRKSLSNVLYLDEKRGAILDYYSEVLEWIIDHIKMIKKTYNYILPKYYRDFN